MKRAVLYMRVSSIDQHPESQLHDLRMMAVAFGINPGLYWRWRRIWSSPDSCEEGRLQQYR